MTNAIRLTKKQRNETGLNVGDSVNMHTRGGHEYLATVRSARRHEMARGAHADGYAPCDVHDGHAPRPSKIKITRVALSPLASRARYTLDDDDKGAHMSPAVYDFLVEHKRLWCAQTLTTYGNAFEFTFSESEPAPIKSARSKHTFERLRIYETTGNQLDAPPPLTPIDRTWTVNSLARKYDDTCDTWRVTGCINEPSE